MKKIFEILPPFVEAANCILICEMSNDGFSFAVKDENQNLFVGVAVYHFDKSTPPVGFPIALQIVFHQNKLLAESFKKTTIIYSFAESVLIPFSMHNEIQNHDILNLMYGDVSANDIILSDKIEANNIYNTFRIPASVLEVMNTQFPHATTIHQYSFLLKQQVTRENRLFIIFYSQKMVVSLIKDGKHELINSFDYHNPQEVAYTLLNICHQFEVPEIDIEISGLVEKKSPLFKEIYKYFQNVELSVLPEETKVSEEILEYPAHYFSHIFALDSCE